MKYGSMTGDGLKAGEGEMLRKARALAKLYTLDQFARLIERCAERNYAPGKAHLILLLGIENRAGAAGGVTRLKMEQRMIEGCWSRRRLDAEIRQCFPKHERGQGRKVDAFGDFSVALTRVSQQGGLWIHLIDAALAMCSTSRPPSIAFDLQKIRAEARATLRKIEGKLSKKRGSGKS